MDSSAAFRWMDTIQAWIAKIEKVIGITAMAFIIVINIYGISSRYLFNRPVLYIQELTILGAVSLCFIGIGLVFKNHADIMVDFVVRLFPHKLRLITNLIVDLIVLLFVGILAWKAYCFINFLGLQSESHAFSFALEIPDQVFFYPIGIGALSIFLTALYDFLWRIARLRSTWGNASSNSGGED